MKTTTMTVIESRCTQCGATYGSREAELDSRLVEAGLTTSHGYCPACAAELEAALERELAEMEVTP